jgi:hypothetical protein
MTQGQYKSGARKLAIVFFLIVETAMVIALVKIILHS